jgi:hypothetical protein
MFLDTHLDPQDKPATVYGVPWQGETTVGDTGDSAATVLADVMAKEEQAAPAVIVAILLEALDLRGVEMGERLMRLKVSKSDCVGYGDPPHHKEM